MYIFRSEFSSRQLELQGCPMSVRACRAVSQCSKAAGVKRGDGGGGGTSWTSERTRMEGQNIAAKSTKLHALYLFSYNVL